MNICQRINAIRIEVPYLVKTTRVESYKAITHDEVTAWVRPHLITHGVVVFQRQIKGETFSTGKQTTKGNPIVRYDAVYEFDWVNMEDPTDRIITVFSASAEDTNDKAPGKCASYAAKTNMLKTLNIETGEDDESRIEGTGPSLFEQWEIKATEVCEAAQSLEDIIKWWPDHSAQIKKELKKHEAAKIYDMVIARKKELQAAEREPGREG